MTLPRNPCVVATPSALRDQRCPFWNDLFSQNWSMHASSCSSPRSINSIRLPQSGDLDIVSDLSLLNLPQGIVYDVLLMALPKNLSPSKKKVPFFVPTFSASVGSLSSPTWTTSYLSPQQWSANSSSRPAIWLCTEHFTRNQPEPLIYLLSAAALVLQWQNWVVTAKTTWPASLNHLLSGLLRKCSQSRLQMELYCQFRCSTK